LVSKLDALKNNDHTRCAGKRAKKEEAVPGERRLTSSVQRFEDYVGGKSKH